MKFKVFDLNNASEISKLFPSVSVTEIGLENILNYFYNNGYKFLQKDKNIIILERIYIKGEN